MFDEIGAELAADGENLVKKINGVFAFKVKMVKNYNNIVEAKWIVDAKNGKGSERFLHVQSDPSAWLRICVGYVDVLQWVTCSNPSLGPICTTSNTCNTNPK